MATKTSKPIFELLISGSYVVKGVLLSIQRSKYIDCTDNKKAIRYAESIGDLIVDKLQESGATKIDISFRLLTTYQIHEFKECYHYDV